MKKLLIRLLGLLLFLGCSTSKNHNINKDVFVKFTNSNKTNIKKDDEVIKDKGFTMEIPNSLITQENRISYYFLQSLKFKNEQKIVTLYIPNKRYVLNKNISIYSNVEFINQLKELDILQEFKEVKFMENRYFNIVLLEDNFFVMYLNVQKKNINDFNYSIKSVNLE